MTAINFPQNRTFGVEIELNIPAGMSRHSVAAKVNEMTGIAIREERYGHSVPRAWKIVTDASLGYSTGAEVVSPVLSGNDGIEQVRKVAEALTDMGCTVNRSTGVHVHVDIRDFNASQIKRLCKHFLKWETFFDHILPPSRRRDSNCYVLSNRSVFGRYDNGSVNAGFAALDQIEGNGRAAIDQIINRFSGGTRYRKMNLHSYGRQGTVEYRHHSGTTAPEKLVNWISLLVAFTEAAANGRPQVRRTHGDVSPRAELGRFFRTFSVCKPVADFYRARMRELAEADRRRNRRR